ncbi:hypothetical protein LJR130_001061 [Variovorax sp. LjRoot130]|uniref:hypothetical protein n=1 Tax=Variovorax sp. LjRoot130 TaxID=3342261 RepID=UPI003ECCD45E
MSRYRKIDQRIWNDEKFRALGDDAKLVFFMLLTHPAMTMLGAMRTTVAGMAEELGWSTEGFREAFQQVLSRGMAEHDPKAHLLALPNFLRYNKPESPNVVKGWASAVDLLPECALKTRVVARSRAYAEGMTEGFRDAFREAFPEAFTKPMPNQEQEQEQEQEKTLSPSLERKPVAAPPVDRPPAARDMLFEEFWKAYPKKVGKDDARKAFDKRSPTRALVAAMMEAIATARGTDQWQREKGQFIPNPATWLNQGRWKDEGIQISATVPGATGRDPALQKLYDDDKIAAKPSVETLERLAALRKPRIAA